MKNNAVIFSNVHISTVPETVRFAFDRMTQKRHQESDGGSETTERFIGRRNHMGGTFETTGSFTFTSASTLPHVTTDNMSLWNVYLENINVLIWISKRDIVNYVTWFWPNCRCCVNSYFLSSLCWSHNPRKAQLFYSPLWEYCLCDWWPILYRCISIN